MKHILPIWLAVLLSTAALGGESEPSLEEALEGFDDETESIGRQSSGDPSLDEALEGFDDESETSDEPALEEVLDGFDDAALSHELPVEPRSAHSFGGSLSFSGVYAYPDSGLVPGGTDYQGISRLRTRMDLEYETDPFEGWRLYADGHAWYDWVYELRDKDYPSAVLDSYQSEVELGELWLRGRLGSWSDLHLGRQIVVWGKSDNLRITDVLNPMDRRELGMVDIEDLRLPVTMSRLDLYHGVWNLSAILVHEMRFDKNPPYGSAFFSGSGPLPPEEKPAASLDNTELALALDGSFSAWDMSLYAARIFDDRAYLDTGPSGFVRRHARISMLGSAANLALGNWLLKAELAHFRGLRLSGLSGDFNRTDGLLGVEYSGFTDASVSFELADRHLHDHRSAPGLPPQNNWQAAFRYQGDFLHDRLHLLLVVTAMELFESSGGFARLSGEYELTDDLDLTLGLVLYNQGKRPPVSGIGDNDRVFMDLEWSF